MRSRRVLTVPLESKTGVLPDLFPLLRDHTIGNVASLALAAAVGGVFAFLVGLPLMRLSGLAAGIATFAVLEITHNLLREWTKIGPGATTLVPETTGALQATIGAVLVVAVAFAYQRNPLGGRHARRARTPPRRGRSGSACTGSGSGRSPLGRALRLRGRPPRAHARLDHDRAGLSRATFLTLAMLVVGGLTSLWGAVVGALAERLDARCSGTPRTASCPRGRASSYSAP